LVGAFVAVVVSLFGTPQLMRWLGRHGIGQAIQDEVGQHAAKAGTPTMGGAILSGALVLGYIAAHLALRSPPSRTGVVVVGAVLGGAAIGAADDWVKVRHERNLGLREFQKTAGLLIVDRRVHARLDNPMFQRVVGCRAVVVGPLWGCAALAQRQRGQLHRRT
jgi:UDP-N-acetylmuramyl pentapeptide phosphotransferase/UDP-N-acetylglucosamine-1-phosphate transferase